MVFKEGYRKRRTLLSWSSGKDSAWALHVLSQDPTLEIVGLFTTVNEQYNRVAMHGVRIELLRAQAENIGLPLYILNIPNACVNDEYVAVMRAFIVKAQEEQVECMAFGDIFLGDVRQYREDRLKETGITPLFPLWGLSTNSLSRQMLTHGIKAKITCVDPKQLSPAFAGREYDNSFLDDLPSAVDPCGENGEFHTFVYDGPMLRRSIQASSGDTICRDGFYFTDLLVCEEAFCAHNS